MLLRQGARDRTPTAHVRFSSDVPCTSTVTALTTARLTDSRFARTQMSRGVAVARMGSLSQAIPAGDLRRRRALRPSGVRRCVVCVIIVGALQ